MHVSNMSPRCELAGGLGAQPLDQFYTDFLPAPSSQALTNQIDEAGSWELGAGTFVFLGGANLKCHIPREVFVQIPGFRNFDWLVVFPHTIVNIRTNLRFLLCVQAY
jgi:hypothetical protein